MYMISNMLTNSHSITEKSIPDNDYLYKCLHKFLQKKYNNTNFLFSRKLILTNKNVQQQM
jgi:hypothetical protein